MRKSRTSDYLQSELSLCNQDKTRAAAHAAERLKSFAGGLRSAILRDDAAVEEQWAPAAHSKQLQSLQAVSMSAHPASGYQQVDSPAATPSRHGTKADHQALDAEMEAFVDDLLANDADDHSQHEMMYEAEPVASSPACLPQQYDVPAAKQEALAEVNLSMHTIWIAGMTICHWQICSPA